MPTLWRERRVAGGGGGGVAGDGVCRGGGVGGDVASAYDPRVESQTLDELLRD